MEKNGQFLLSKNETLGDPVFAATEICWREMVDNYNTQLSHEAKLHDFLWKGS
jgi:hypothetical protein